MSWLAFMLKKGPQYGASIDVHEDDIELS